MPRKKTNTTALTIGQLAKRWSVAEDRVRQLIDSGRIIGVFRIPAAGRYREVIKIPLASVLGAEQKWEVNPASAERERRPRAQNTSALLKHFPELIDDSEPAAESHEVGQN